ncbi:hypothetical protein ACHAWC_011546 [Mediolabrus comicus]
MSYLQNSSNVGRFQGDDAEGSSVGDVESLTVHEAYEVERPRTTEQRYYAENQDNYISQSDVVVSNTAAASTTKFWSKKRKIVATISSVVLVIIAAAVGIALSNKSSPSNQTSLAQDVLVEDASDAPPSIVGDAFDPVVEEILAVEPVTELISTEVIDDGIVYDVAAQQEVTTEGPDFDLDIVEFTGDLSDFIDSDLARFSIDADSEDCNNQGALLKLEITTDLYQWENEWFMEKDGEMFAYGPPENQNYQRLTKYRGQLCVPPGSYNITFVDEAGDGMCCDYGKGSYKVTVGEVVVAESKTESNDPFNMRTYSFEVLDSTTTTTTSTIASTTTTTTTTAVTEESVTSPPFNDVTSPPFNDQGSTVATTSPTSEPTAEPTGIPTSSPSSGPTTAEPTSEPTPEPTTNLSPDGTSSTNTDTDCVVVGIQIQNGSEENGYTLQAKDGSVIIKDVGAGTMKSDHFDEACVPPGIYQLILTDTKGDGIPGYIAVYMDGERVLEDWQVWKETWSYDLIVGFKPVMTELDTEWLGGHNLRRQEFHELHNKEFRPVTWSPTLAEEAKVRVEEMISAGCKLSRDPNSSAGENLSAMITNNESGNQPSDFMRRWYDNKVDKEEPGLAFSQFVWRASRYIGCSKEVGKLENGQYCHVALCRYARAGNCNMGDYASWLDASLSDKSVCGPMCVEDDGGCY